eukprot:CAMPEP_0185700920 /NCGR_PEP_ID=MMETSP1164-20130828/8096_1 /TAXON_ID=1104430 /ORGANISM="Chrysoreinhardia sp, Strain CCMP2950" /LENGTH=330 /DNA_ID=CAMNT_0028367891 /DNA_START=78 /DNA_END=1072 /DNA_ORIENTATION=+
MPKVRYLRNYSKTSKTPRRPYEKERIDGELKLLGEYGLRCKRELWRMQYALAKIRKAARELLTLDPKDPKRIFEGGALLRRMARYGLLDESELELDSVLQMTTQKLLERRLQTKVFKQGLAKSIHHARVLIKQRHIRVGKQVVNVPSFMVRVDSEKHIDFAVTSPYGQGRPGRVARKRAAAKAAANEGGDGGEESDEPARRRRSEALGTFGPRLVGIRRWNLVEPKGGGAFAASCLPLGWVIVVVQQSVRLGGRRRRLRGRTLRASLGRLGRGERAPSMGGVRSFVARSLGVAAHRCPLPFVVLPFAFASVTTITRGVSTRRADSVVPAV